MVFGSDYDKSLWMMIKNDKKNRDRIVDFIKSIPLELYWIIEEKLLLLENYNKDNIKFCDREEKHLNGNVYTVDGLLYWFYIDSYNCGINIGYSEYTGEGYDELFEMTLYPRGNFECMDNLDSVILGNIEYDIDNIPKCGVNFASGVKTDYKLIKTPIGYMMVSSCKEGNVPQKINFVNLNKIPSDLDVQMLNSNKLVRSRK